MTKPDPETGIVEGVKPPPLKDPPVMPGSEDAESAARARQMLDDGTDPEEIAVQLGTPVARLEETLKRLEG